MSVPSLRRILALVVLWLPLAPLFAQDGALDPFTLAGAPDGPVHGMVPQRDGKVVIVGEFTHLGSTAANRIARVNLDGTIDASFAVGAGANGPIYAIAADPTTGQLFIGGAFTTFNNLPASRLASLSSDGVFNTAFTAILGPGPNDTVRALVYPQSSSFLVAAGDFTSVGSRAQGRVAIFSLSGSLIPRSGSGADATVRTLLDTGSAIIVGGDFTTFDGQIRNRLAALSSPGTSLLSSFNTPGGPDGAVYAIATGPSSPVLTLFIGGAFTKIGSDPHPGLAAVNPSTGALISTFTPTANGIVRALLASTSGSTSQLVVAGDFTEVAGQAAPRVGRIVGGSSWTLDTSFAPGGADAAVRSLATTYDGKTLLGGSFTQVAGSPRASLARLYGAAGANPPAAPAAPQVGGETDASLSTLYSGVSLALGYKIDRSPDGIGDWTEIASAVPNSSVYNDLGLSAGATYFYRFRAYNSNGAGAPSPVASGTTFAQPWRQAGAADTVFNTTLGAGVSSYLQVVLPLPDGKTLVGGSFTSIAGQSRKNIARLLADGSVDPAFNPGVGPSSTVYAIAVQPDGAIVIGGNFTTVAGVARNRIARLAADGSLDTAFDPGTGANFSVNAVAIQPDGAIIIAGDFSTVNGVARAGIARLSATGALDTTFDPGTGLSFNNGNQLALQPDGKIVVVGFFSEADGVERGNIARFLPDGTLDTSFAAGAGADGWIESVRLLPDGKFIVAGPFHTYNSVSRAGIARLLADGSLDTSFAPGSGLDKGWAYDALAQPDGKIIAGGWFLTASGKVRLRLARFHANGALDESFQPGLGVNSTVYALGLLPDGKLLIGGTFNSVGGSSLRGLARLLGDLGTAVPSDPSGLGATPLSSTAIRLDWPAASLVTGYQIEQSPDGATNWTLVASPSPGQLTHTVTGLPASAVRYFRLRALNTNGPSAPSAVATAQTFSAYAQWALDHGLAADTSPTTDTDGDGLANLLEYALGSHPADAGSHALPSVASTEAVGDAPAYLTFTYVRLRPELTYRVEASSDLLSWSDSGVEQGTPAGDAVVARAPISGERLFLRLVVSKP